MKYLTKGIVRHNSMPVLTIMAFCIALAVVPVKNAFAKSEITDDTKHEQLQDLKELEYEIHRLQSIFSSPEMIELYVTRAGYSLPANVNQTDNQSEIDTLNIEVDTQQIMEQVQQELREAQKRLEEVQTNAAADSMIDMEEINRQVRRALREVERVQVETMRELRESGQLEQLQKIRINFEPLESKPFMGVFIEDLTFRIAYEKHYDYNYGVLIEGVQPGSPAHQANIITGDILMEFDGEKVLYEEVLKNLISAKSVGDTVRAKLFRNEKIFETELVLMPRMRELPPMPDIGDEPALPDAPEVGEMPAAPDTSDAEDEWSDVEWDEEEWEREWEESWEEGWNGDFENWPLEQEGFFEFGYGGGGYMPIWFVPDFSDLNTVITDLGFAELPDYGVLLHGGGGKGPVGNGWFIGGMGAGYSMDRKIQYTINEITNPEEVIRRMQFKTSFGGVTFDKRLKLSEKFMSGVGFLIGGGGKVLEVSQSSGVYDWDTIGTDFSSGDNGYFRLKKRYLVFQPKAMLHYRLTPWLSLRGELGYYMGFSFKNGWEVEIADDTFDVLESPDSNFYDGLTFSIGPWFGF
jgi:hypothetical protein